MGHGLILPSVKKRMEAGEQFRDACITLDILQVRTPRQKHLDALKLVCAKRGLPLAVVLGKCASRPAVTARNECIEYLYYRFGLTHSQIASLINRDRSTISYHLRRICGSRVDGISDP